MNKILRALSIGACLLIISFNSYAIDKQQRFYQVETIQPNLHTGTQQYEKRNFTDRTKVAVLESDQVVTQVATEEGEGDIPPESQTSDINNSETKVDKDEPTGVTKNGNEEAAKGNKSALEIKKRITQSEVPKPVNITQNDTNKIKNTGDTIETTTKTAKAPLNIEKILAGISNWWFSNPISLQIWYLFFLVGLVFYLFKLRNLRRPLLFLSIIILGFYLGNSLDPIGAVFSLVPRRVFIFDTALILTGMAVILSLWFGRFFCGWICPLGAVQEFVHPKTNIIKISTASDKVLKNFKYIVLVIFLYLSWQTGKNLWSQYDPMKTLIHFKGASVALFILILLFVVSVIIERPFCRYACPLGAVLSLTSRIAPFRMRSDANNCMVCGKCTSGECQMNAIESMNRATDLPKIDSSECINCLDCQNICQRTALRVTFRRIDRIV